MSTRDAVRMLAVGLPVGQTMRAQCPTCRRLTMSITRLDTQNLAWLCHRAMCGERGRTRSVQEGVQKLRRQEVHVKSSPLPQEVHDWLCERYSLEPETIKEEGLTWWDEKGRVLSPIRDPAGKLYGYAARAVKAGFTGPKSLTVVQDTSWPGGAFTAAGPEPSVPLLLVEDVFSAYAAAEFGYRACALLGTHCTEQLENLLVQFPEVVVALDEDATGKAARLVQQLGYMNIRQMPLEKDIKDMAVYERAALLSSR